MIPSAVELDICIGDLVDLTLNLYPFLWDGFGVFGVHDYGTWAA